MAVSDTARAGERRQELTLIGHGCQRPEIVGFFMSAGDTQRDEQHCCGTRREGPAVIMFPREPDTCFHGRLPGFIAITCPVLLSKDAAICPPMISAARRIGSASRWL